MERFGDEGRGWRKTARDSGSERSATVATLRRCLPDAPGSQAPERRVFPGSRRTPGETNDPSMDARLRYGGVGAVTRM